METNNTIDLAVAVNFFSRPETLYQTLTSIKRARPSRLYLIADGPRETVPDDRINCQRCREIAETFIDWDCDVFKLYNEKNKGLFVTYFESMETVFQNEEYCVFLEDDVVPSVSFFFFCKEMLERFKNDLRVSIVTGINFFEDGIHPATKSSYFFAGEGALQAYGIWNRTFKNMNMSFLDSQYDVAAAKKLAKKEKKGYEERIARYEHNILWQGHIPHVEVYKNLLRFTEHQLCIVPSKNLVRNIGLSNESSHSANDIRKIPKATQYTYTTPVYELDFPLIHPTHIIEDVDYNERYNYLTGWNRPILKTLRRFEALIRHLIFGDFARVKNKINLVLSGKYVFDE